MNLVNLFEGKLTRQQFLKRFVMNIVVMSVVMIILSIIGQTKEVIIWGTVITMFLAAAYMVSLYIRRLRDTGHSPWWILIVFVPFGGLGLLIYSLVAPSSEQKSP